MYDEMTGQAVAVVRESAVTGPIVIARSADGRYVGQGYELTVPVPAGRLDATALAKVRASFDEVYAARYGFANPAEPVEIVTWKLSASAGAPRVARAQAAAARRPARTAPRRACLPPTRRC